MWGRMSAAKPPRAAPRLAVRGGTAVAPRHKGALCPIGPVSARLCPKSPRPAVQGRPSVAPLPMPLHAHLRVFPSPATADCRPLTRPSQAAPRVAVGRAREPRQRREHGPRPTWPWAVRPRGRGPHPHCATGPIAVSAQ
jgi:hypothetical protein